MYIVCKVWRSVITSYSIHYTKLYDAIFGEKAGDVKDASLKASPSLKGVVIDKKLFSRIVKDRKARTSEKSVITKIEEEFHRSVEELRGRLTDKLFFVLNGKTSQGVKDYFEVDIVAKGT